MDHAQEGVEANSFVDNDTPADNLSLFASSVAAGVVPSSAPQF